MNPPAARKHDLDTGGVRPGLLRDAHGHERGDTLTWGALRPATLLLCPLCLPALQFPPPEVERGFCETVLATEPADGQPAASVFTNDAPPRLLAPFVSILAFGHACSPCMAESSPTGNPTARWGSPDAYQEVD